MKPFVSCPDPATITPSTIEVFGVAPGRSREDVRNAVEFRRRAAERSKAAVAAIEALHTDAATVYKVDQQVGFRLSRAYGFSTDTWRIWDETPIMGGRK